MGLHSDFFLDLFHMHIDSYCGLSWDPVAQYLPPDVLDLAEAQNCESHLKRCVNVRILVRVAFEGRIFGMKQADLEV